MWVAGAVGAGVDMDGAGGGSGTAGAEIVADDATWLLDGKVGASSCFFPFLAIGEYCKAR